MPTTIDPTKDKLVLLSDVPRLPWLRSMPRRRGQGKSARSRINLSTVYRWRAGVRNPDTGERVRLACIRIGGPLATTEAALRDFFAALAATSPTNPNEPSPAETADRHARAERELEAAGIL